MTYIETIKQGTREYYYLTKNIRISSNKWKKIRIFIGDKKPSKEEITKLATEIEKKVKSLTNQSLYSYLSTNDSETLQDLKESYSSWLKQIPKSVREKLNEDFVI